MVVQVNYAQVHKPFHVGQIADGRLVNSMNGLPAVDLPYGAGVIRDPSDSKKINVPTTAAEAKKFIGIVMYELNRALLPDEEGTAPKDFDCTVITEGDVAVRAQSAVAVGDPVYLIFGETGRGTFRNDANTDQAQLLSFWEWKTSTGAGDVGVIGVKANVVSASQAEVEANDAEIQSLDTRVTNLENAGG